MDAPYGPIITLLAFIAAYQYTVKRDARPVTAALIAIGLPYAVTIATRLFFISVYEIVLFPIPELISTILGLCLYVLVFKEIRDTKSPLGAGIWGVLGFIFVAIALPALISGLYTALF